MLPLQQAYEVKQSIIEYLKATFDFKENISKVEIINKQFDS